MHFAKYKLSFMGSTTMPLTMEGFDSWFARKAELVEEITIDDFRVYP